MLNMQVRAAFLTICFLCVAAFIPAPHVELCAQKPAPVADDSPSTSLTQFVTQIRGKAKGLESSAGMKLGFETFASNHKLTTDSIRYSDFVLVRLLFEATRDAGFWNLHWSITDQPPNSDNIWRQWGSARTASTIRPTATAECDELSALYAFLVERSGVKSVGLFWPYPNHTVAVWELRPAAANVIRVVVPTSQIFLDQTDFFDTRKFNPWTQKRIYEYTRRDVPDSFEIPKPLFNFFLAQIDRYAGASDSTLQQLRYLREGVFVGNWTVEQASRKALATRSHIVSAPPEDLAAYANFIEDMRSEPAQ